MAVKRESGGREPTWVEVPPIARMAAPVVPELVYLAFEPDEDQGDRAVN